MKYTTATVENKKEEQRERDVMVLLVAQSSVHCGLCWFQLNLCALALLLALVQQLRTRTHSHTHTSSCVLLLFC